MFGFSDINNRNNMFAVIVCVLCFNHSYSTCVTKWRSGELDELTHLTPY